MKKQLEIATIKANSTTFSGCQLYWLFSRNQLEFVFKEVEVSPGASSHVRTARYEDTMLPVLRLERYYGLEERHDTGAPKYFVVRTVDENMELVKLIVESSEPLNIHKLETGCTPLPSPSLPKNSEQVLGMYSLAEGKLAVVPDLVGMYRSLQV